MKLKELVKIRTGKLDANASNEDGKYPFFTCSKIPLKIKNYSYNCECVLVAGNGDLNVKYYNGKFDAYQRTYIIETIDSSKLNTRFLFHFMSLYVNELKNQSIGSAIKFIKLGNLQNANIPLYSLEKQLKINSELDNYIRTIEMKQTELNLLNNLIKSRFVEMFGDPKTNSKQLPIMKPIDICESISAGGDKPKEVSDFETDEFCYPIYSNGEKDDGLYGWSKLYRIDKPAVTVSGRGTIGYASFRKSGKFTPIVRLIVLIPNNKINPIYLTYFLNFEREEGSGSGVQQLTVPMIKQKKIIVPDIELQNEFESFVKQVDKSKFINYSRYFLWEILTLFSSTIAYSSVVSIF